MLKILALLTGLLAALPDALDGQVAQLLGCYDLDVGAWSPSVSLGEDSFYVAPPSRFELTDYSAGGRSRQPDPTVFAVLPAPGALPSVHEYAYWSASTVDSIQMVWSNGFSGIRLQLHATEAGFQGRATSFWDFPRERQEAAVAAHRVTCDAPVPVDLSDRTLTLRGLVVGTGDSLVIGKQLPRALAGDRVADRLVRLSVDPGKLLLNATSIEVSLDSAGILRAISVSFPRPTDYPTVLESLTSIWGAPLAVQKRTTRDGAAMNLASWHDRLTIKWAWGIEYPDGRGETKITINGRNVIQARQSTPRH